VPEPPPAPTTTKKSGNVVQLRTTTQVKPVSSPIIAKRDAALHIIIGDGVIAVIRQRGEDILLTEKAGYCYSDGTWSMEADRPTHFLDGEIEKAIRSLNYESKIKIVNEVRQWILRQDTIRRRHKDIPWDQHGMVPTKNGLVDPRTLKVRPAERNDFCTWRVEAEYDPDAKCPHWLQMLEDVFADRPLEERAATIRVIQELAGAGLIDNKPRELSRALVFQGGSNFGKSGLIDVLSGLFGSEVNSTPIDSLEGTHGTMQFLKRAPWVLHEAFDQRKWSFSSSVKAIITGDPININIKNGAIVSHRVTSPIFWGSNHPLSSKNRPGQSPTGWS
jgi:phage/plasmid-associated DNA primase